VSLKFLGKATRIGRSRLSLPWLCAQLASACECARGISLVGNRFQKSSWRRR